MPTIPLPVALLGVLAFVCVLLGHEVHLLSEFSLGGPRNTGGFKCLRSRAAHRSRLVSGCRAPGTTFC